MRMGWSRVGHPSRRWLLVALALVIAAGVGVLSARLAAPSASASVSVPAAAPTVAASGVADAPCALLTSAQRRQLRVNAGVQSSVGGEVVCVWRSTLQAPWGGEYLAKLVHGPAPQGSPAPSINTRPTSEYQPPGLDPNAYCVYLVTLAPEQTLWAQYGGPNQQGVSHVVACRRAQAAAANMTSTFGAMPK
jgi:hypothetical protein